MFNYQVNWDKVIKENVPSFLHSANRLAWITALFAPAKQMYNEFLAVKALYIYKVAFNGQVIYLEKILNDKFDPTGTGIYISDAGPPDRYYIYRISEAKPPIYLYRRWQSTVAYTAGDFAVEGQKVYKSLTSNSNTLPSSNPTDWAFHTEIKYLRQRSEFALQYNFIVNIPVSLVFNLTQLCATLDYYRLAGQRYKIVYY